jgi:predicted murein hydrolase (TIGR00659 family)
MIGSLLAPRPEVWVYLAASPLSWLTLTLIAFVVADKISIACYRHPAANLVAIAAAIIIVLLKATGTSYDTYFAGAQFVHFLLGPTTVALAVPLYRNFGKVKAEALPFAVALLAGSVTAIVSAVLIARWMGVGPQAVASLAPKSVTAPIAMGLSERIGGAPFLTAAMVMATGIFGAIILTPLLRLLRVNDSAAIGAAAGLAAHGIGTARAFQIDSTAGAFAGIAMGLNGALTSLILPILAPLLGL